MHQGIIVVDIGGSHIAAVMINKLESKSLMTPMKKSVIKKDLSKTKLLDEWAACINEVIESHSSEFSKLISIAIPGPFDYKKGIALYRPGEKFSQLHLVNVKEELANRLGQEIYFHFVNDATCFGIGESYFGFLNDSNKSMAITLGTGIGCTFLSDNQVVIDGNNVPDNGEISHLPMDSGIADDYFSTRWFIKEAKEKYKIKINGVKELSETGEDHMIKSIFANFTSNLYGFLLPICKNFGAKSISIGGNISKAWKYFGEDLSTCFIKEGIKIFKANDTELSICLGAAISLTNSNYKRGKRILIAPDKFKGSLTGPEICKILRTEIESIIPEAIVEECPLADGGDGSVKILAGYLDLKKINCTTVDPLRRSLDSSYYSSGCTAYIELASASGLVLLDDVEKDPLRTSTYGTGLQIKHAIESGIDQIYLFLGGSATNDGGLGIANALGYKFYDVQGSELLPIGASLNNINKIVPPKEHLNIKSLTLCCDVVNIPFGPNGAAYIFAKQKGANQDEIIKLDEGLANLCEQVKSFNGIDITNLIGGGAAGGVPISLTGFMDASITSGMELIAKISMLDFKIANADLVISGEGKLDLQSLNGKVVNGVSEICRKYGKKLLLVVGRNDLSDTDIKNLGAFNLFSVLDLAKDMNDAMTRSAKYVKVIGKKIAYSYNDLIENIS